MNVRYVCVSVFFSVAQQVVPLGIGMHGRVSESSQVDEK